MFSSHSVDTLLMNNIVYKTPNREVCLCTITILKSIQPCSHNSLRSCSTAILIFSFYCFPCNFEIFKAQLNLNFKDPNEPQTKNRILRGIHQPIINTSHFIFFFRSFTMNMCICVSIFAE